MSEKLNATKVDYKLNNGRTMPALGFGTFCAPEDQSIVKDCVIAAVKAGYRHIDTAYLYQDEKAIGDALQELFKEGVVKREDLFITTKVWPNFWDKVEESFSTSLKNLQLEYVDLVLQHWPLCYPKITDNETGYIVFTPKDDQGNIIEEKDASYLETYKQLEKIYLDKNDHRIKSIGVSNYTVDNLKDLFRDPTIQTTPSVNQIAIHPGKPQNEIVDYCQEKGIVVTGYTPYGSQGGPALKLPLIKELSEKLDLSVNEVVISYFINRDLVIIPRTWKTERIPQSLHYKKLPKEIIEQISNVKVDFE
ncbi:hypothetical protein ACO0QE_004667 [Hanseniaspora vineae]